MKLILKKREKPGQGFVLNEEGNSNKPVASIEAGKMVDTTGKRPGFDIFTLEGETSEGKVVGVVFIEKAARIEERLPDEVEGELKLTVTERPAPPPPREDPPHISMRGLPRGKVDRKSWLGK